MGIKTNAHKFLAGVGSTVLAVLISFSIIPVVCTCALFSTTIISSIIFTESLSSDF